MVKNTPKKGPIFGTVSRGIVKYAKYLAKHYRESSSSEAERLKNISETKAMIAERRQAIAVLRRGNACDVNPHVFPVIADLEKVIAQLYEFLPKRRRPVDWRVGLFLCSLANFIQEKTRKPNWLLVTKLAVKHIGVDVENYGDEERRV